jgi:hypothetical protein
MTVRTYYGRPVVKEPEWTWEVPWYLFAGGLAGAASLLAATADATGERELATRLRLVSAGAAAVCPPLLIADLGRPARFLNMLRVFKVTSVMSVGSWTLFAYTGAVTVSTGLHTLDRLPRLRPVADGGAAVLGVGMATYTGALLADTSIPAWHEARGYLPAWFAASSLASASAAGVLVAGGAVAPPAIRALTVTGAAAELGLDRAMRSHLRDELGERGDVYEHGQAGRFHRVATAATAVGGVLVATAGRRRWQARAGAAAVLVGSVCQRWAAYHGGFQSARDPVQVVEPQRARLDRGEGHRRDTAGDRDGVASGRVAVG